MTHLTYNELETILTKNLGFEDISPKDYKAYCHKQRNATIVLPARKGDEPLSEPHFFSVRSTLIGKGIVKTEKRIIQLAEKQRK